MVLMIDILIDMIPAFAPTQQTGFAESGLLMLDLRHHLPFCDWLTTSQR